MPTYFVQAGENGPIKIGFTKCVTQRVASLQGGSSVPLRLLAAYDCSLADEKAIHDVLAPIRIHREWYRPHRAIQALMCLLPEVEVGEKRCPKYPHCSHIWARKARPQLAEVGT